MSNVETRPDGLPLKHETSDCRITARSHDRDANCRLYTDTREADEIARGERFAKQIGHVDAVDHPGQRMPGDSQLVDADRGDRGVHH
jgi:hypothetical protein